jgi:hypothetical protein
MPEIHVMSMTFLIGLLLGIIIQAVWNPAGFVTGA